MERPDGPPARKSALRRARLVQGALPAHEQKRVEPRIERGQSLERVFDERDRAQAPRPNAGGEPGDRLVLVIWLRSIHRETGSYAAPAPRGQGAFVAALLALCLATASGPDRALAASTGASQNADVALVSENAAVRPGRPFYLGLRMRMKQGWHTYWNNPGDSGLPTKIDWKLPEGFLAGSIEWPAPERMPTRSEMSYGYAGEVVLPVLITPPSAVGPDSIALAAVVHWLECADVCLPGSATLDLKLPVTRGEPVPGPDAGSFATARSMLPRDGADWQLASVAGPRAISLEFRPPKGVNPKSAYLFVDRPLVVDYAASQPWGRLGDGFRLTARPAPNAADTLERLTGVLVVEGRGAGATRMAIRVDIPVLRGDPAPFQPESAAPSTDRFAWITRTAIFAAIIAYLSSFWTGAGGWPFRRRAGPGPPEEPHPIDPKTNGGPPSGV